jgi:hypothetical protein
MAKKLKPRLMTKKMRKTPLTPKKLKKTRKTTGSENSRGAHRRDRGLRIEYTRELLTPKRRNPRNLS